MFEKHPIVLSIAFETLTVNIKLCCSNITVYFCKKESVRAARKSKRIALKSMRVNSSLEEVCRFRFLLNGVKSPEGKKCVSGRNTLISTFTLLLKASLFSRSTSSSLPYFI